MAEKKNTLIRFLESQDYKEDFRDLMIKLSNKYGSKIIDSCGIGKQLSMSEVSKKFFRAQTTADASVDGNANVSDKSVISHSIELAKPFHLINSYYRLWKELKKNKSKEYADYIIESQISGRLYVNDFVGVSTARCYCFNYSTYDIALLGISDEFDGRNGSVPPKNLMSFFGQLELFALIAGNSTLGATGLADLLIVASIFIDKILQTGEDSHVHYDEKGCWNYAEALLCGFIYRLNQPYRGSQSLFTNVSIYDSTFIDNMLEGDSYQLEIDGVTYKAKKENIQKLQDIYLNIMNREMERKPLTFPVTTATFAVDDNNDIIDKEFLDYIAEKNLKFGFINIYSGKSSTLSSCCFDGKQKVYVIENAQPVLKQFNELAVGKMYYVQTGEDEYKLGKCVKTTFSDGYAYTLTTPDNNTITCTHNHIFPTNKGELTAEEIFELYTTGESISLYNMYKVEQPIVEVKKQEVAKDTPAYCFEMLNQDKPYFVLPNGIITHNCRLRSERDNEYFNSFGSGSTKIGSLAVATGNLPQLAFRTKDKDKFLEELKQLVIDCQTINNAKRNIVNRAIKAGVQPLYTLGYMSLKKQYSTFGVIGLYEALEILGMDIQTKEGQEYALKMLNLINDTNEELQKKFKYPHNCEQIPGENVAVKLASKDKLLGYNDKYTLYSNQFVPLIKRVNMLDRIEMQGLFDRHFSGGAICHLNMDQEITNKEVMRNLIETCAKRGVVYFAINFVLQECANRHLTVGNVDTCPICGEPITGKYTRVVGFLVKVGHWLKTRREEDFPNRQFYGEIDI